MPLPPDKVLSMGTGTGTKGDAIPAAAPPTMTTTEIHLGVSGVQYEPGGLDFKETIFLAIFEG